MSTCCARTAPNSHAKPGYLGCSQLFDDRLESVVAPCRPGLTHPELTEWQIDFIVNNEHAVQRSAIPVHNLVGGNAGKIHECLGRGENHFLAIREVFRELGPKARSLGLRAVAPGEFRENHEADVVPGIRVFASRISKTNDNMHVVDALSSVERFKRVV